MITPGVARERAETVRVDDTERDELHGVRGGERRVDRGEPGVHGVRVGGGAWVRAEGVGVGRWAGGKASDSEPGGAGRTEGGPASRWGLAA